MRTLTRTRRGFHAPYDRHWVDPQKRGRKPYYRSFWDAVQWPRPPFTIVRSVPFSTKTALQSALSGAAPGDYIFYNGTGVTTFGGSGTSNILTVSGVKPTGQGIVVDFGSPASSDHVFMQYTGTTKQNCLYINNSSNIHFYGGEFSAGAGGSGIVVHGGSSSSVYTDNVHHWDFYIHDCGGTAITAFPTIPAGGASGITNCTFRGECYNWGTVPTWDSHTEKQTGLHGCNTADYKDSAGNSGVFDNNIFMLYVHHGTGAGIENGEDKGSAGFIQGSINGNSFYIKAEDLYFHATIQTAGNAINFWGTVPLNTVIEFVQHENSQGRTIDVNGVSNTSVIPNSVVKHARAKNVLQNTTIDSVESKGVGQGAFPVYGGPVYWGDALVIG